MRFVNSILSMTALAIMVSSCSNTDFKKTKGGMPYKVFASSSGTKIEPGNFVKANVIYKIKDSTAFNSYGSFPVYFQVNPSQPYDISEVLPTLKKGDSVYAVQLIDTFMARTPSQPLPPQYKKGDKITTSMKILEVFKTPDAMQKDEESEKAGFLKGEDAEVKSYLSKHNIDAQKLPGGTYVQVTAPGQGPAVQDGKFISIMYKGSTFAGKVFDTNMDPSFGHTQPLSFVLGNGGMIKGFNDGLQVLKKGSKARIFIPSMLGYGAQPPSPAIKPFENLIFDVEVLDVQDKAPARKEMPSNMDSTQAHK